MSRRAPWLSLVLVAAVLAGCTGVPSGPLPTMPRPSYAPVVVPEAAAEPRKGGGRATPRPGAMTDAAWRTAFCEVQDKVFELEFAVAWWGDRISASNIPGLMRSTRVLDSRVDRARAALQRIPARYARPLVAIEFTFLRAMSRMADLMLAIARTRSPRYLPPLKDAVRDAQRGWKAMVRVNQRMHRQHDLVCM